jgi:hypothetical protein
VSGRKAPQPQPLTHQKKPKIELVGRWEESHAIPDFKALVLPYNISPALQIEVSLMRRTTERGESIDQIADEWPACRHH